jgi:hypothetical protein
MACATSRRWPASQGSQKPMHQFTRPRHGPRRNRRRRVQARNRWQSSMRQNTPHMDRTARGRRLTWQSSQKPMHQFPRPRSCPRSQPAPVGARAEPAPKPHAPILPTPPRPAPAGAHAEPVARPHAPIAAMKTDCASRTIPVGGAACRWLRQHKRMHQNQSEGSRSSCEPPGPAPRLGRGWPKARTNRPIPQPASTRGQGAPRPARTTAWQSPTSTPHHPT